MAIYRKEETTKNKIVLHHTMSNHNFQNVLAWWEQQDNFVSTPYVIDGTGFVHSVYPDKYWSYHLGIKEKEHFISKKCIPIELTNWGSLYYSKGDKKSKEGYYSAYKKYVFATDSTKFYKNEYRGFEIWHKYTPDQIKATYHLIKELSRKHNIDIAQGILQKKSEPKTMFYLSDQALSGLPGLWMHCNYRLDKLDLHPQDDLIDMFLSL